MYATSDTFREQDFIALCSEFYSATKMFTALNNPVSVQYPQRWENTALYNSTLYCIKI